jgi:hypothetical protein
MKDDINDIKEAINRHIPIKVEAGTQGQNKEDDFDWYCTCGKYLSRNKNYCIIYCPRCGQKLDWD